jgi:F420-0:gamma-glutamyl ligase-like protein
MIKAYVEDGDFVAISEKAISIALGNVADESKIKASSLARFLARFWLRIVWGRFLGALSRMSAMNIRRMRSYPIEEGARHKQLCLWRVGFYHALKHWSEGGIDASNLPELLVSLPLPNADEMTKTIKDEIRSKIGKNVVVVIVDSDKTFTAGNIHLSSRPTDVKGIYNLGPLAFILGRALKLRPRSTPVGISDEVSTGIILNVAAVSNISRGTGAGSTVWDISSRFNTTTDRISWGMLESIQHSPVVLVRLME